MEKPWKVDFQKSLILKRVTQGVVTSKTRAIAHLKTEKEIHLRHKRVYFRYT